MILLRRLSLMQRKTERGMCIADILTHDLLNTCPLFEGDFPAEATKSKLVSEIAPSQRHYQSKWDRTCDESTAIHVDVMSRARRQPLETYATLGELANSVLNTASTFCHTDYVHMLLDSYVEFPLTLKEPKRLRRSNGEKGIGVVNISSPTPQQKELFWASESNKRNLQKIIRDVAQTRQHMPCIYISSMIENDELLPAIKANGD